MDQALNERLRRLARYGDDMDAVLELLRESERQDWMDERVLPFSKRSDPFRMMDRLALSLIREVRQRGRQRARGYIEWVDQNGHNHREDLDPSFSDGWYGHLCMLGRSEGLLMGGAEVYILDDSEVSQWEDDNRETIDKIQGEVDAQLGRQP